MQWSDAASPPPQKVLRQFAGLWVVVFGGMAAWRVWHGPFDTKAGLIMLAAVAVGGVGLVRPATVRWIYTAWMIVAFPIGWTVSKVMLGAAFFVVFTPVALVFRLMRRDALQRSRRTGPSHLMPKTAATNVDEYFRQS